MLPALLADYGPSAAAFALFALFHSIGAREPFKRALGRWTGLFFVDHFWRAIYCALSFAALYRGVVALLWGRHADNNVWLMVYPAWLWQLITVVHLGSVALLYLAFWQSDYFEFLGLTQAWRGLRLLAGRPVNPASPALFGTQRLVQTGLYGWVRHPMLAAGLLFLLTSGPSLNNLIYTALYTLYMLIGGHYEERRLVKIFGQDYLRYRSRVGAFFPRLRRRPAA
jgi:hypothetical protein